MTTALIIIASFAAGCVVTYLALRACAEVYDMVNHIISGTAEDWYVWK